MTPPRLGMVARVRNRLATVSAVEEFGGGAEGVLHLVRLDYCDGDGVRQESVLWQREPDAELFEPGRLPDPAASDPMPAAQYDALVRSARWQAMFPYVDPGGEARPLARQPLVAPLHAAVQTEDCQMIPLLKAARMPRVSLLLADDVGLGKTIEAGLILKELILRRRIQRVLILWRVDAEKDPELRHTVLSLEAYRDLQEEGLEAFMAQNDGEGSMLPETLWLADYGLGRDARAQSAEPVAPRLGPRFHPWQLEGTVEESWEECRRYAANLGSIFTLRAPAPESNPHFAVHESAAAHGTPSAPVQLDLLGIATKPDEPLRRQAWQQEHAGTRPSLQSRNRLGCRATRQIVMLRVRGRQLCSKGRQKEGNSDDEDIYAFDVSSLGDGL